MTDKRAFQELAGKVADGRATDEELLLYNNYLEKFKGNNNWNEQLMGEEEHTRAELLNRINKEMDKAKPAGPVAFKLWYKIAAAAVLLVMVSAGLFFYMKNASPVHKEEIAEVITEANDILPGTNKAILILTNGRKIDLNQAGNGLLAEEKGIKIIKIAEGQLLYDASGVSASSVAFVKEAFNTMIIPRGGTYQLTLTDGTKVWLNAVSTLKFPLRFASLKKRTVELNGEAYFEVAKMNGKMPFMVASRGQEVEVLGTHFNINSYANEPGTKTTLVEGAVRVSSTTLAEKKGALKSLILKPGQNSLLSDDYLKIVPGDVNEAIAWQQGRFLFNNEHITSIMRRIARWYDVEAIYPETMPRDLHFSGSISRNKKLSQILRIMELTRDVQFRINDRKLYVMRTY